MNGYFNGIQLRKIIWISSEAVTGGAVIERLRVLDKSPELEERLQVNALALLILSNRTIEGRILHFFADMSGYIITIQVRECPHS
jgi:CRP-like cAMP-binding protein